MFVRFVMKSLENMLLFAVGKIHIICAKIVYHMDWMHLKETVFADERIDAELAANKSDKRQR
jgi:hypothetical protein